MKKICVVVTARPSYSRVKTALRAIDSHPDLELQLVVAASALLDRYGEVVKVIEKDGFEISERVFMTMEGENLVTSTKSTGLGIIELATVFDNHRPDVVVTIADRFETMATAVAASYMNIPLAHIQGGEVTGSIDEKVRHAITKLADLHLVSTQKARQRVSRMGEDEGAIHVVGCPSIDLAKSVLHDGSSRLDPFVNYGWVGRKLDLSQGYTVVMQHPVTTEYEKAREHVEITLEALHESGVPTLWFWPNVDAGSDGTSKGIRAFRESHHDLNMAFFKNLEPQDFLRLLLHARAIIGNSSVAIRECSFLGVPAINIGARQVGRERGPNTIDVVHDKSAILEALSQQNSHGPYPSVDLYGSGNAGDKIAEVLARSSISITKRLTY